MRTINVSKSVTQCRMAMIRTPLESVRLEVPKVRNHNLVIGPTEVVPVGVIVLLELALALVSKRIVSRMIGEWAPIANSMSCMRGGADEREKS